MNSESDRQTDMAAVAAVAAVAVAVATVGMNGEAAETGTTNRNRMREQKIDTVRRGVALRGVASFFAKKSKSVTPSSRDRLLRLDNLDNN